MDIKQLQALLAVVETGSVTRAALLLHIVQPAVTRHVRTLERDLGVDLFERTQHGMIPTNAGTALVGHARRVIDELDRARSSVQESNDKIVGSVRIGILDSITDILAEELVSEVMRKYPDIRLHISSAFAGNLRKWLYDGDLDVSVLFGELDPSLVRVQPVATEQMWVMAPKGVGLVSETPVNFWEIANHPLIVPARGHALRALIDQVAARAGVQPKISVQINASRVAMQLAAKGHGWTVLPAVCAANLELAEHLSMAPLADETARRHLSLAFSRSPKPTRATELVAREVLYILQKAAQVGSWPSVTWRGRV